MHAYTNRRGWVCHADDKRVAAANAWVFSATLRSFARRNQQSTRALRPEAARSQYSHLALVFSLRPAAPRVQPHHRPCLSFGALRQPRRFALLVYLALEGRTGYARRDRVLGTFWPESADADGRRALSQALHFLRQHLGAAALETRGQEELRLADVSTDACQLLAAADGEDPEAVVRLAAGEFLPGFFSGGLREFDDWVDRVHADLRRAVADAAWAAAEQAADRSEWVAAGAYARRAAAACQGD